MLGLKVTDADGRVWIVLDDEAGYLLGSGTDRRSVTYGELSADYLPEDQPRTELEILRDRDADATADLALSRWAAGEEPDDVPRRRLTRPGRASALWERIG